MGCCGRSFYTRNRTNGLSGTWRLFRPIYATIFDVCDVFDFFDFLDFWEARRHLVRPWSPKTWCHLVVVWGVLRPPAPGASCWGSLTRCSQMTPPLHQAICAGSNRRSLARHADALYQPVWTSWLPVGRAHICAWDRWQLLLCRVRGHLMPARRAQRCGRTPKCMIKDPIGSGMHCALSCKADTDCGEAAHCDTTYGPASAPGTTSAA